MNHIFDKAVEGLRKGWVQLEGVMPKNIAGLTSAHPASHPGLPASLLSWIHECWC